MDDLISRQEAIESLVEKGQCSTRYRIGETWELNGSEIREVIESLPSKQSERRIGYWIIKTEHPIFGLNNKCVCCSKCNWVAFHDTKLGQRIIIENEFNYCPNCGADKRGVQDD